MSDQPPIKAEVREGFLDSLLGDIPSFVRGILATMFGTTICLVAMLQLGGLQVPFTNWLTSQITPQVRSLDESVARLSAVISRIESVETKTKDLDERIRRIERRLGQP